MTERTPQPGSELAAGSALGRDRRRSRRQPLAGVLVAIEAPEVSREMCWAGSGIDINGDGLSLSLPSEVQSGSEVLLTFRLGEDRDFHRVPGVVVRQEKLYGVGAIQFLPWPPRERLDLVQHLIHH